jgi:hypothetical protein
MLGEKIWPKVEDSLFFVLGRERHTSHVGERDNLRRKILYEVE